MTDSWILKAIEDAAMARAHRNISSADIMVFGLGVTQIVALSHGFEQMTGKSPMELTPEGITRLFKERATLKA